MPELPEVQTVVSELNQRVKGRTIQSVSILRNSIIQDDITTFTSALPGRTLKAITRKGKYILFELDNGSWLIAHLRMTGKFIVQHQPLKPHHHDRVVFLLDRNFAMIYNDVRCFGTLRFSRSIAADGRLNQLGWDPWDKKLTTLALKKKLHTRSTTIKSVLLDQRIIAGLGNIYASEILFNARINPFLSAKQITRSQAGQLIESMRYILREALKYNGTTISDYRRVDDKQGGFQAFLSVYGKEGFPCVHCSTSIKKSKQNQRSTYYCSQCQQ